MVEIKNVIKINKSTEEVFDFLTHFENIPLWNYYVICVQKISPNKKGVGTVYHQIRRDDEQKFRIAEYNPPGTVAIETIGNPDLQFKRTMRLNQIGNQTRIVDHFEVDTGRPALLEKAFKNRIKSAVNENLHNLKELLEAGSTVLPDGRMTRITKN